MNNHNNKKEEGTQCACAITILKRPKVMMKMNNSTILLGSNMKTICALVVCALLITLVRGEEPGVTGYRDPGTVADADETLDEASLPLDPSSKSGTFWSC